MEPATKTEKPKKKVRVRAGAAKPPRPAEKKEAREDDEDLLPSFLRRTLKKSTKSSKLVGNVHDANPKAKAKARCSSFLMRMRMCKKKDKSKSKSLAGREKRARIQEIIRKRQEEKNKLFGDVPLVIGSSDEET